MQIIRRFFAGWTTTFQQQGCVGKVLLVTFSLIFLCFVCGIPIGIWSPSRPSSQVASNPVDVSGIQTLSFNTAIAGINQTETASPLTNTPEVVKLTPLPTFTLEPSPISDQVESATEISVSTPVPVFTPTSAKDTDMQLIPAGQFVMGGSAELAYAECQKLFTGGGCDREWFTDEEPAHTVYLNDFYIDKYEVSNAAYRECVNSGTCQPPIDTSSYTRSSYYENSAYDDYPVVYVDWNMANKYCEWRGAHLPTEAEWEKAARGTDGRIYPWGNTFDGSKTNFCDVNCFFYWANKSYDDSYSDTAPVAAFSNGISEYGVFNLAGNVWEWVADWYDSHYYVNSPSSNPLGPSLGEYRVLRGGSLVYDGNDLRSSNRLRGDQFLGLFGYNVGFRCSR